MGTEIKPQIIVNRFEFTDVSTIGNLSVDNGLFQCQTLEDTVRRVKKPGETAIPAGIYRLTLENSPKFGFVPHILNVPLYTDILIHAGNQAEDTRGCLLVGRYNKEQKNWVGQSRSTLKDLMDVLVPMNQKEKLYIEIRGGLTADQMSF